MTWPSAAATMGLPHGAPKSIPAWRRAYRRIGWTRYPKPDVIRPFTGAIDPRRNRLQIIGGDLRRRTGGAEREIKAAGNVTADAFHVAARSDLNARRLGHSVCGNVHRRLRHGELAQLRIPYDPGRVGR